MQALDALFRDVDVLIGPLSTGPMMVASNFTGHPAAPARRFRRASQPTALRP
ncbi:MAG: hypothetical protein HPM95_16275 [Alphaproteobacteria bacterium]|nr:hypothetical protein [Alphaproteobacteria bacterium]